MFISNFFFAQIEHETILILDESYLDTQISTQDILFKVSGGVATAQSNYSPSQFGIVLVVVDNS